MPNKGTVHIKHTLSFFISNAGKMRLVWSFTIFRVVADFRCLEKIKEMDLQVASICFVLF